jgi:hypothetical protein
MSLSLGEDEYGNCRSCMAVRSSHSILSRYIDGELTDRSDLWVPSVAGRIAVDDISGIRYKTSNGQSGKRGENLRATIVANFISHSFKSHSHQQIWKTSWRHFDKTNCYGVHF